MHNRRRRAGRTSRDLLVLEAWGFKRILDDICHLDDALVETRASLLAGSIPNEL